MDKMFTDRLFNTVEPIWNSHLEHPFVKGIGQGTVDKAKFIHYMKQDYLYLNDHSRVFANGSTKATDLLTMTMLSKPLHDTMSHENDLQHQDAEKFDIPNDEQEDTEPSATMTAYTSYMISQAQLGGVENAVAAVLACAWSYNWIGKKLAEWPGATEHEFYGNRVKMYSSEGFTQLAEKCEA